MKKNPSSGLKYVFLSFQSRQWKKIPGCLELRTFKKFKKKFVGKWRDKRRNRQSFVHHTVYLLLSFRVLVISFQNTLQGINISHQTGKGKSSTQNAIFGGYVSSLEGMWRVFFPYQYIHSVRPEPSIVANITALTIFSPPLYLVSRHVLSNVGAAWWESSAAF